MAITPWLSELANLKTAEEGAVIASKALEDVKQARINIATRKKESAPKVFSQDDFIEGIDELLFHQEDNKSFCEEENFAKVIPLLNASFHMIEVTKLNETQQEELTFWMGFYNFLLDVKTRHDLLYLTMKEYSYASAADRMTGFDLTLITLQENEQLAEDQMKAAKRTRNPILIKRGEQYSVYGCKEDQWEESPLNNLSDEEKKVLQEISFNVKVIDQLNIKTPLLKIVEKSHTWRTVKDIADSINSSNLRSQIEQEVNDSYKSLVNWRRHYYEIFKSYNKRQTDIDNEVKASYKKTYIDPHDTLLKGTQDYLAHLEADINKASPELWTKISDPNFDLNPAGGFHTADKFSYYIDPLRKTPLNGEDTLLKEAVSKYREMKTLEKMLTDATKDPATQMKNFHAHFQKPATQKVLTKRRDSAFVTFSKIVASVFTTVFTGPVALYLLPKLWRSHGSNYVANVHKRKQEQDAQEQAAQKRQKMS